MKWNLSVLIKNRSKFQETLVLRLNRHRSPHFSKRNKPRKILRGATANGVISKDSRREGHRLSASLGVKVYSLYCILALSSLLTM